MISRESRNVGPSAELFGIDYEGLVRFRRVEKDDGRFNFPPGYSAPPARSSVNADRSATPYCQTSRPQEELVESADSVGSRNGWILLRERTLVAAS